jgi:hypothetical protein
MIFFLLNEVAIVMDLLWASSGFAVEIGRGAFGGKAEMEKRVLVSFFL